MLPPTVKGLIWILDLFFPPDLNAHDALHVLAVFISLYPLVRLHQNQIREAYRGNAETGWVRSVRNLLKRSFRDGSDDFQTWTAGEDWAGEYAGYMSRDMNSLLGRLGLDPYTTDNNFDPFAPLFQPPQPILVTAHLDCRFCPVGNRNLLPSLRRRKRGKKEQDIWLLDPSFKWVRATLIVATCSKLSKNGVWAHRDVALAQESALQRFHTGWSNFADWINDPRKGEGKTHLSAIAATLSGAFLAPAPHGPQPAPILFLPSPLLVPGSCGKYCTHVKRYWSEQNLANVDAHGGTDVAGSEAGPAEATPADQSLPANLSSDQVHQAAPAPGEPRGYVRMMVMDGKTITHKICAVAKCKNPLVNYKNGRFCAAHLNLKQVCGIVPCGRPICSPDALTCNDQAHTNWHKQYNDRFHRLSFPGVRRVIRRQREAAEDGTNVEASGPSLQVQLQSLGDTPGDKVVHTFKARTTYCLETAQWSCGYPIGWGKCYDGEGLSQVLDFLNDTWTPFPNHRPNYIVYDKACELLRHIVTQNPLDTWLKTTSFIVDAWHYIGHRASDLLCRTRCNPAPLDGSQPDLVLIEQDDNGETHKTRAFNTETAEQFNSWLNGFESQLKQMTDVNYDFSVHVLMLLYAEKVQKQISTKHRRLTSNFWREVNGEERIDED
ncbi:hypothetical protein C8F01DRAFT_1380331 [Mycena amicta]|nr:hypothetical protein C8F01DRAFT_1380331 [Mycena amicta]